MSTGKHIEEFYKNFIYTRTYSRWDYDKNRREKWNETVDRYFNFMRDRVPNSLISKFEKAHEMVEDLEIMPSMRALWSAGDALERDNIAGYNCAYLPVNNLRAFSECLYILMNGTGVGFSVERQYTNELPDLPKTLTENGLTIKFEDSKAGWATGLDSVIKALYTGKLPKFDLTDVREEGSILRTFGGRSSGPAPLKKLLDFTVNIFQQAVTRNEKRLNSLECHDIMCAIASAVVVGGVRRSACISLSNLSDLRMRNAKEGQFWLSNPQRALSNNSVAYTEKPEMSLFLEEWVSLMKSGTGERGIFNRESANYLIEQNGRRKINGYEFGINPCSEIILRPNEFCNLTEVVVRPSDKLPDLQRKVQFATILGVLQSTLTDFKFINEEWKKNCDEERLLGVSLTGIMDHPVLSNEKKPEVMETWLSSMKETAINVAEKWSKALKIPMPAAISCTKPSGCHNPSQKIKTTDGVKTLENIFKENGIDLSLKQEEKREWYEPSKETIVYDKDNKEQRVTKLFINGMAETLKLTMEDGSIVECTPNHKFLLVTGEWKEAQELSEEDDIKQF